jgi:sulfotransferase 6B1
MMTKLHRKFAVTAKFVPIVLRSLSPSAIKGRLTGPRVLVNSIPKSGTNLLHSIVLTESTMRAAVASTIGKNYSSKSRLRSVRQIKNGQCRTAHLGYSDEVALVIGERGIRHLLLVRDFRDCILSNIYYVENIDTAHPHARHIKKLSTFDDKILFCLTGSAENFVPWPELISRFMAWIKDSNTCIIRYESLLSECRTEVVTELRKIFEHIGIEKTDSEIASIADKIENFRGPTFNSPGIKKWKSTLSNEQVDVINFHIKKHLESFGYYD